MFLVGVFTSLSSSVAYVLRMSYYKRLSKFVISLNQVNLFYRIFSLFFLTPILIFSFRNVNLDFYRFIAWIFFGSLIHSVYGIYQVHVYQKHLFSSVNLFDPIRILLSAFAGVIVYNEILSGRQWVGILIICLAFIVVGLVDKSVSFTKKETYEILALYIFSPFLQIVNKGGVISSNPIIYTYSLTGILCIYYFIYSILKKEKFQILRNKALTKNLMLTGFFAAVGFTLVNFSYLYLQIGIVTSLFSLSTFISLWISKNKFEEKNLKYKLTASILAFIGVLVIVL